MFFCCSKLTKGYKRHSFQCLSLLTFNSTFLAELRGIDLQTGLFTLQQIKAATKNFDPVNKLGEGGFGVVYKVILCFSCIFLICFPTRS